MGVGQARAAVLNDKSKDGTFGRLRIVCRFRFFRFTSFFPFQAPYRDVNRVGKTRSRQRFFGVFEEIHKENAQFHAVPRDEKAVVRRRYVSDGDVPLQAARLRHLATHVENERGQIHGLRTVGAFFRVAAYALDDARRKFELLRQFLETPIGKRLVDGLACHEFRERSCAVAHRGQGLHEFVREDGRQFSDHPDALQTREFLARRPGKVARFLFTSQRLGKRRRTAYDQTLEPPRMKRPQKKPRQNEHQDGPVGRHYALDGPIAQIRVGTDFQTLEDLVHAFEVGGVRNRVAPLGVLGRESQERRGEVPRDDGGRVVRDRHGPPGEEFR